MNWKETILHIEDIPRFPRTYEELKELLLKQAEPSYKAGMREWYCKVNETPGKQEGGTMRERPPILSRFEMPFASVDPACTVDRLLVVVKDNPLAELGMKAQRDADVEWFREKVEKVELLDYPPFLPIYDRHLYAKGFIVCRQAILALLQKEVT